MNEIIKYEKAKFEKNKLTLADDITIDQWKELGQSLKQVEGSVQFWIGDWLLYGEQNYGEMYKKALEDLEYEYETLRNIKYIAANVKMSLRNDNLTFNHHKEVAKLEPDKQKEFLDKAVEEKLSVRDLRRAIVKVDIQAKAVLPSGKFRIIYADPPWKFGNDATYYGNDPIRHYPAQSIEELCALPIKEMAEGDSILFLWVTSPHLEECFQVINAWGFKYKSSFVWDKVKHNMGHYNSVRHEFLLICTKGSCTPDNIKLFDSVQTIERNGHSEKPEEFRNIIDTIYPYGKRIELFARKRIKDWESYGNELS